MKFDSASKTWACPVCLRADAGEDVRHLFCLPPDLFDEVTHNDEQSSQRTASIARIEMFDLLKARMRQWWHCLIRLHRPSSASRGRFTIWVGCGDCDLTFYFCKEAFR
jgi:hypothetical protein